MSILSAVRRWNPVTHETLSRRQSEAATAILPCKLDIALFPDFLCSSNSCEERNGPRGEGWLDPPFVDLPAVRHERNDRDGSPLIMAGSARHRP
jgi:hypothetical protein